MFHPNDIAKIERAKHLAEMACDRSIGHASGVWHYLWEIYQNLFQVLSNPVPDFPIDGILKVGSQSDNPVLDGDVLQDLFSKALPLTEKIQERHANIAKQTQGVQILGHQLYSKSFINGSIYFYEESSGDLLATFKFPLTLGELLKFPPSLVLLDQSGDAVSARLAFLRTHRVILHINETLFLDLPFHQVNESVDLTELHQCQLQSCRFDIGQKKHSTVSAYQLKISQLYEMLTELTELLKRKPCPKRDIRAFHFEAKILVRNLLYNGEGWLHCAYDILDAELPLSEKLYQKVKHINCCLERLPPHIAKICDLMQILPKHEEPKHDTLTYHSHDDVFATPYFRLSPESPHYAPNMLNILWQGEKISCLRPGTYVSDVHLPFPCCKLMNYALSFGYLPVQSLQFFNGVTLKFTKSTMIQAQFTEDGHYSISDIVFSPFPA